MKKLLFGLIILGLTTQVFAQKTETLPEVVVRATNYKYLNSVNPEDVADVNVKMLEEKVASFDLENAEFYDDDYDLYRVRFYIPEGKILAAFDEDGNIIRTAERFKNVVLPSKIKKAIGKRFPGWGVAKDLYSVRYYQSTGVTKKMYKVTLKNGDKKLKVKVDEDGNFI